MEVLFFLIGLVLGGTLGLTLMCCLQVHRLHTRPAPLAITEEDD